MPGKEKKKQKANIHPNFRKIKVVMTDGTEFFTYSTIAGQKNTKGEEELYTLPLDIDPNTHIAWTKQKTNINTRSSKVKKFNDQFGDIPL